MPVTGLSSLARARSRSARGTSSTISRTWPAWVARSVRPTVAVVLRVGLPAGTRDGWAGSSAKQLAAVRIQWASTRAPEQLRAPSPMSSFAVNA